jgi:hypothetical protein
MRKLASVLTILILGTSLLYAHHGWTGYDETKPLNFTGVIKESGYENPHGFVNLEVDRKIWRVVLAPPSRRADYDRRKDHRTALIDLADFELGDRSALCAQPSPGLFVG